MKQNYLEEKKSRRADGGRSAILNCRRLLLGLTVLLCLTAADARAQYMYSDTWTEGPSPDDENIVLLEDYQGYINGAGVTEEDYYSGDNTAVDTWITSPSGRTSYARSSGYSWSRAHVALPINLEAPEEGDWVIHSQHYASDGPHVATFYNVGSSRSIGNVGVYRLSYRYVGFVGSDYFYTSICASRVCSSSTSKRIPASKWGFPYPFVNCYGIGFNVFGFRKCISGCLGSNTGTTCI